MNIALRNVSVIVALLLLVMALPCQVSAAGGHGSDSAAEAGSDDGHHEVNTNPMSIKPDLAIFTAIVFALLMAFLGKFAWRPIMEGLEKREGSIAQQIEEAAVNAEKAAAQLQEYEAKLASATAEAQGIVAKAQKDAEATKDRIVAEAKEAATRERERALAEIDNAKNAALTEIAQNSVNAAVGLASRIVRREIKSDDHATLISDALERFPSQN